MTHPTDPTFVSTLGISFLLFAAIAAYAPHATTHISRRGGLKPPHPTLILVIRLWFALLALGCLTLLVLTLVRR